MNRFIDVAVLLAFFACGPVTLAQTSGETELEQLIREMDEMGFEFVVLDPEGKIPLGDHDKPISARLIRTRPNVENSRVTPIQRIVGIRIDSGDDPKKRLTEDHVDRVARLIPNLQVLDLSGHRPIQLFSSRLEAWTKLKHLRVSHDRNREDVVPLAIPKLKQLESLHLWNGLLNDKLFADFASLTQMRRLTIAPITAHRDGRATASPENVISAETLSKVIINMPRLEFLDTARCNLPGSFDWPAIAKLPKLKTLNFRWSTIDDEQIVGIDALDQVENLALYYAKITGKSLPVIARMESLKYLGIHHTSVTSNLLALKQAPSLESLGYSSSICRDEEFDAERLQFLAKLSRGYVEVGHADSDLMALATLNKLLGDITVIEQQGIWEKTRVWFDNSGSDRSYPRRLGLQRLLSDVDYKALRHLPKLSKLVTEERIRVTSEQTEAIQQLPSLTQVEFDTATIDRDFVDHLCTNNKLERIYVKNATIIGRPFVRLARAKSLRDLTIEEATWQSDQKNRCAGVELAALERLRIGGDITDSDCRFIGNSRSLRFIDLGGDLSVKCLAAFSQTPQLQNLGLDGLKLANVEEDLRRLRNPSISYVRLNAEENPTHFGSIYSDVAARDLGITMAGECSCSCMDVMAPPSVVVPDDKISFSGDFLKVDSSWIESLASLKREKHGLRHAIRIVTPIDRRKLVIDASKIAAERSIYLSKCLVDEVVLIPSSHEAGIFGSVETLSVQSGTTEIRGASVYCHGVTDVIFESSNNILGANLSGDIRSIRFNGDFPKFENLSLATDKLKYLSVPHQGSAPRFTIEGGWKRLGQCRNLRLLKIPGTNVSDATWLRPNWQSPTMPPIHELDLRGTAIGDAVLEDIASLKSLKILKLSGCKNVTAAGIKELSKTLPDLRIEN